MRLLAAVALSVALVSGCAANGSPEPPRAHFVMEDPPASHSVTSKPPKKVKVADPERIRIPSIGVDAAIIKVGLKGEGERKYMETPPGGENLAGWYSPKLPKGENPFPRPGEVGAAVIAGHVDSKEGADVFYRLKELQRGAEILVTDKDKRTYRFKVVDKVQTDKDQLPTDKIWNDPTYAALRLITCGGPFNKATGHYAENVTIFADKA